MAQLEIATQATVRSRAQRKWESLLQLCAAGSTEILCDWYIFEDSANLTQQRASSLQLLPQLRLIELQGLSVDNSGLAQDSRPSLWSSEQSNIAFSMRISMEDIFEVLPPPDSTSSRRHGRLGLSTGAQAVQAPLIRKLHPYVTMQTDTPRCELSSRLN